MISVDEAYSIIDDNVKKLAPVHVPLERALGHAVAETVYAVNPIPYYDNSAMDGFAIIAADTVDADPDTPVTLDLIGEVMQGQPAETEVKRGTAVRISTGGMIPPGADSVIRVEDTETFENVVSVFAEARKDDHIRRAGEDVEPGQIVLEGGTLITPADLGMLAAVGMSEVPVTAKPKAAFMTTGDELIGPDEPLAPGKVRNTNRYTLGGLFSLYGIEADYLGHARDSRDSIAGLLERADGYDLVVTSGAVSVGEHDLVKEVLTDIGMTTHFWRIAQRPGKPLLFGSLDDSRVFGLPGNPVSVMVTFYMYVLPAIWKMMGIAGYRHKTVQAQLEDTFEKKGELTYFSRGIYSAGNGKYRVTPWKKQGSNILHSMSRANCLIVFPQGEEQFRRGDTVEIVPLR